MKLRMELVDPPGEVPFVRIEYQDGTVLVRQTTSFAVEVTPNDVSVEARSPESL